MEMLKEPSQSSCKENIETGQISFTTHPSNNIAPLFFQTLNEYIKLLFIFKHFYTAIRGEKHPSCLVCVCE